MHSRIELEKMARVFEYRRYRREIRVREFSEKIFQSIEQASSLFLLVFWIHCRAIDLFLDVA